jgi:hypothetical protein
MHNRYANRKDISILVIEKNIHPYGAGLQKHDISDVGDFLYNYGFSVEMIWGIHDHQFEDFYEFKREAEEIRDERLANIDSDIVREGLGLTLPSYKSLRRRPIDSMDDLAEYSFIITHPSIEDADILLEFVKKYPDIPLICPDESVGLGSKAGRNEVLRGVTRDKFGVYIVSDYDMCLGTIELIEHLLDQNPDMQEPKGSGQISL